VRAIVGDRAYRGFARLAERKHLALDINAPPPGTSGFTPLWPLYRIEHAFAQLGRWRRLSRCYEIAKSHGRPHTSNDCDPYTVMVLAVVPAEEAPAEGPGVLGRPIPGHAVELDRPQVGGTY